MPASQVRANQIKRRAERLSKKQTGWRRHLHMYPELSTAEHKTTAYLKKEIKKLGLTQLPISLKTGLVAELRSGRPGPTVAVRTDIDALPVTEMTRLKFKSRHEGCMHACGHDVHMATVLGTAALLADMKDSFSGSVRFIFQPAEERPPGGARPMIENGALDGVAAIFGLHVDPHLPTGKISLRDGVAMSSVYDFDLDIIGRSGHAARPHECVDAIVVASEVVQSLQTILSREVNPITPALITIGKIQGGAARNVIADRVTLTGTARTLSRKQSRKLPGLIKKTVAGVCRARGADFDLKPIANYPILENHARINQLFRKNFTALFGPRKVEDCEPTLGGEDFACYLQKVPGAMFRLGVQNKKIKADKPWHSSEFIADEQSMYYGTALLTAVVLDFLEGHH